MISIELKKRIITSIALLTCLALMYFYFFILIIFLILISLISWIEFNGLILKIFKKRNLKEKLYKFILKSISLLYLSLFCFIIVIVRSENLESEVFIIYSLFVSINSDIGGLLFGKVFKGRKLTKISPNKTISGSIGSFIFSFFPLFFFLIIDNSYLELNFNNILFFFLISLISQLGDLFVSFFKRKAKIKDTGKILPGHGGILDRVDGIIFAIPFSYFLLGLI